MVWTTKILVAKEIRHWNIWNCVGVKSYLHNHKFGQNSLDRIVVRCLLGEPCPKYRKSSKYIWQQFPVALKIKCLMVMSHRLWVIGFLCQYLKSGAIEAISQVPSERSGDRMPESGRFGDMKMNGPKVYFRTTVQFQAFWTKPFTRPSVLGRMWNW